MSKNIDEIVKSLEILKYKTESDDEFQERVILAYLNRGGDAFHVAELLTGKDYKTFNGSENMLAFGLHLLKNDFEKESAIKRLDTFFNMPWEYYQEILKYNEFSLNYEENFNEERNEVYQIWTQEKNGIFLTAESYGSKDKTLNSTYAHFELDLKKKYEEFDELDWLFYSKVLGGTSNNPVSMKIEENSDMRTVNYDGRSNLLSKIKSIENSPFSFNNPWKSYPDHFLWLSNYSETNGNYKEIRERKIKKLPDNIKKMIGYPNLDN